MKKILNLLLALFPIVSISQTVTENYIKTTTYKVSSQVPIPAPTIIQAVTNITYFDGLGRPKQVINVKGGGNAEDIITHIGYDEFGRQEKEYLPYSETSNDGVYRAGDMDIATKSFYNTAKYENTGNPYSQKKIEDSPLNRILKQAAPGENWKLGNGHEIKMDYQTNTGAEVINFEINLTFADNTFTPTLSKSEVNNGFYNPNELYKNVTYDENTAAAPIEANGSTVEFKNKEGQVVLKRTYGTVEEGVENQKYDTYYLYDIYGNLTYVIPPKATDLISETNIQSNVTSTAVVSPGSSLQLIASNSIILSPGFNAIAGSTFNARIVSSDKTILDNLCYQYKYDNKNRLVEKKLPGKQWEFIVYDKLNRIIATGPAVSPFNDIAASGWNITKYDVFDRPVITAWLSGEVTAATRKSLQKTLNELNANFSETKINTSANTTINGVSFRYSSLAWPTTGYHILTVNYFDDYNYPDAPVVPATVVNGDQFVYYNNTKKPKGLSTGSWTRILETSTVYRNELSYTLYDAKARPVRTYVKNFLDGYVYTDSKLDSFSGQLQYNITKHRNSLGSSELKIKEEFAYSEQNRLVTQKHQINDSETAEIVLSNTYDELGKLISKKVGNNTQNINYGYNIRGWLTAINDIEALSKSGDLKDLFAFKINYNTTTSGISGVSSLYNGNISEIHWATNSDNGIQRTYGYRYDNMDRLKEGIYKKGTILNTYNESMNYDKNGNIMHMKRYGSLDDNTQTLIDNLTYDYKNSGMSNELAKVTDGESNNPNFKYEFKDSAANVNDDFNYDANGNMTKDDNKNIIEIKYNHLNLPTKITFATTGNIVYLYNAVGQKVQKIINQTGIPAVTTDYLGGYQYSNNTLKFFPTPEGYVEHSAGSYKYIYQYKDHLGNVRLSYDKTLAIQDENNYYPFGLKHQGYNNTPASTNDALKYKYNGKELQDELELNMYDMDMRQYDPATARWIVQDPIVHLSFSPYSAFDNNPALLADPTGAATELDCLGREKFDNNGIYIPPYERSSTNQYIGERPRDINTSKALKQSAKLYFDGEDVSKLNENDKQKIFKESSLKTIGVLLWEFATGTGKNVRDFYYNEHPFATEYVNSRINEIINNSNNKFKKMDYETKDGLVWNTEKYKIGLPFSPTINPASWGGAVSHILTSNAVCQFIGGAVATLQINNGIMTGTISNDTSRNSFMLHVGDNYIRKNEGGNNRILSTITQKIHFTATITK